MTCGDNKNSCHDFKELLNIGDYWLGYCKNCKKRVMVKAGDKKKSAKLFKKESLQPGGNNLYYKYYGKMNTL